MKNVLLKNVLTAIAGLIAWLILRSFTWSFNNRLIDAADIFVAGCLALWFYHGLSQKDT